MQQEENLLSSARALHEKVKRQERAHSRAEERSKNAEQRRFFLLMRGMVQARKALREMQALDMGERFTFVVVPEESNGWPILTLKLQDSEALDADFPGLKVSAVEVGDKSEIRIETHESNATPERIEILHELDVATLNKTVKEKVKDYLDFSGTIIEDVLTKGISPYQHGPKSSDSLNAVSSPIMASVSEEELFAEDEQPTDPGEILDTVSEVEEIESLPALGLEE